MDLTPIILGIIAANVGTLMAGTALAIYRARQERVHAIGPRGRSAPRSGRRQTSVLAGRSD